MGKPPFIMSTMYKTIFDDTKTMTRSLVIIYIYKTKGTITIKGYHEMH